MKKISILIPCYNEEENAREICNAVRKELQENLSQYDFEIVFIDNKSSDNTRKIITELCQEDTRVKAIFNMKNFGQFNSPYYGLCQTTGDCTIMICADFQDPVDMIPLMVEEWEKGNKVICMVKKTSKENKIVRFFRTCYYKIIKKMSDISQIEHFTGFGLYDRSFLDVLQRLDDSTPFLRGVIAEYAPEHLEIPYEQQKRKGGRTHNNFYTLYDAAMLSFTSYTKGGLRLATFAGVIISAISFLIALFYLVYKLAYWDRFNAGNVPILLGVFFFGGIQLFFLGLLGEYIMSMNIRAMNRPLVIEEERLNFEDEE